MIVSHPGSDAVLQLFKHDRSNTWHIEFAGLRDRQPDQLNEFFVGADKAVVVACDRRDVGGEEPAVEPQRAPRRRNGAGNKVDRAEVGRDMGFGEGLPGPRRDML